MTPKQKRTPDDSHIARCLSIPFENQSPPRLNQCDKNPESLLKKPLHAVMLGGIKIWCAVLMFMTSCHRNVSATLAMLEMYIERKWCCSGAILAMLGARALVMQAGDDHTGKTWLPNDGRAGKG